jgi:hypothetical protein
MTLQTINIGGYANDGTGDDLRTAFLKVNENFTILGNDVTIANGKNIGIGAGIFAQRQSAMLAFKSLISRDNSVIITSNNETINLQSKITVESDKSPKLGNDLDLNGYTIKSIISGGIEAPIYGIDIPTLNGMVQLLLASNTISIDMGSIEAPTGASNTNTGINVDMNNGYPDGFSLIDPMPNNQYDFGNF